MITTNVCLYCYNTDHHNYQNIDIDNNVILIL